MALTVWLFCDSSLSTLSAPANNFEPNVRCGARTANDLVVILRQVCASKIIISKLPLDGRQVGCRDEPMSRRNRTSPNYEQPRNIVWHRPADSELG
jgi:hypothetical protein